MVLVKTTPGASAMPLAARLVSFFGQDGPKMASKTVPRRLQGAHDGLKKSQDVSKTAQDAPKTA
eukprot:716764-Pyramimonas_sp.AAC.1